jgi:hypothetical protein
MSANPSSRMRDEWDALTAELLHLRETALTAEEAQLIITDAGDPFAFANFTDAELDIWDSAMEKLRRICDGETKP